MSGGMDRDPLEPRGDHETEPERLKRELHQALRVLQSAKDRVDQIEAEILEWARRW